MLYLVRDHSLAFLQNTGHCCLLDAALRCADAVIYSMPFFPLLLHKFFGLQSS